MAFFYIVTALSIVAVTALTVLRPVKKQSYKGQHVIITGGSQGMGKAVALQFIERGADVTILARTQATLDAAQKELESVATSMQSVKALSVDCTDAEAVVQAIAKVGTPDVLFCCAGTAHPGLFTEMSTADLARPMTGNYLSSLYTAHAGLKAMLAHPSTKPRKIVFTSSIASFLNAAGYSSYTPTKVAIRALADTLRLEVNLYDSPITIHCVFPGTILSPGFENEQKLKPEITKILEEGDQVQTPDEVARHALQSLDRGEEVICTSLVGRLLYVNMKGASPKINFLDMPLLWIASLVLPFVFYDWKQKVTKYQRP